MTLIEAILKKTIFEFYDDYLTVVLLLFQIFEHHSFDTLLFDCHFNNLKTYHFIVCC